MEDRLTPEVLDRLEAIRLRGDRRWTLVRQAKVDGGFLTALCSSDWISVRLEAIDALLWKEA